MRTTWDPWLTTVCRAVAPTRTARVTSFCRILVHRRAATSPPVFSHTFIGDGYCVALARWDMYQAVSLHLIDTSAKHKQATRVLRHLRLMLDPDVLLVVGGDFNSCAETLHRRFRALGLVSAVQAHRHVPVLRTHDRLRVRVA